MDRTTLVTSNGLFILLDNVGRTVSPHSSLSIPTNSWVYHTRLLYPKWPKILIQSTRTQYQRIIEGVDHSHKRIEEETYWPEQWLMMLQKPRITLPHKRTSKRVDHKNVISHIWQKPGHNYDSLAMVIFNEQGKLKYPPEEVQNAHLLPPAK